jgi:hypothetical protein
MPSFRSWFDKQVRLMRQFDRRVLTLALISKLRDVEVGDIQVWRQWRPWELLLLIQWALEHGRDGGDIPDQEVLGRLMNAFNRLGYENPKVAAEPHSQFIKYTRMTAHQQFWWQRPLTRDDLGACGA